MLGRQFICPSKPANQRITLQIDEFERDLAVLDLKNMPSFKEFLRLFRSLAPPVHVHQGGSPIHRVTCGHVCLLFVMGTDQFGGDFRGKASSIVFMIAILMIYDFNLLGIDQGDEWYCTMRTNLLIWCNLVSISNKLLFQVSGVVRIY